MSVADVDATGCASAFGASRTPRIAIAGEIAAEPAPRRVAAPRPLVTPPSQAFC